MIDPIKKREYNQRWYAKDKENQKQRIYRRRAELKLWLKEYKATLSCDRCPEDHPATLEFHHLDPAKKEIAISEVIQVKGWGKERIQKEIDKCIVLCANCHRKEHTSL